MYENLPRLGLPLMQQGQAQKHVTHNEALELLDILVQLTVETFDAVHPPASTEEGQIWALAAEPTGAWAGQGGRLAAWANGGWLFVTPKSGWRAARGDEIRIWTGSDWVAPRPPDLNDLQGIGVGTSHDAENRLAVASPAALFTHAGDDHRLTINKATAGSTASVVFQNGWSGRAEMGLAGEDNFSFKVSADGSSWSTGLRIAAADGSITVPAGLTVEGALNLPAGSISRTALASGAARSVIGRSGSTSGAVADIAAGTDHQVLRRSGTSIGFGAVNLGQAASTTGQLPISRGGTGAETAEGARASLGLGTAALAPLVGTVSESAGIPTGAVIERGFNAHGEYVRFADGTQICWHAYDNINVNTAAGAIFQSNWQPFTFPAAFSGPVRVSVVSTSSATSWAAAISGGMRVYSFQMELQGTVRVCTIGRWF